MYIRRVVVRNFRALKSVDITFQPGLTCLIGENNSGKTTLLQALRLVLDSNLSNYSRSLSNEDFSAGVNLSSPQQILIAVELTNFNQRPEEEALVSEWVTDDDVACLCYRFKPNRRTRDEIKAGSLPDGSLTIENYDWQLAGIGGKDPASVQWDDELAAPARFDRLGAFNITFLQALRDVEDDLRRSRFSPLTRLLDEAGLSEKDKNKLLDRLRDANTSIKKEKAITDLGKSIQSSLLNTVGDVFSFGVDVGIADPTFSALAKSLVLLLSTGGLDVSDPSRNGLGLNNVLYISMLLEVFRKRISRPNVAGQLLLVEEPEAHLHPELQRIVFSSLQSSGCQVLTTTHSTHVTSIAPLLHTVVLTKKNDFSSSAVVPASGCNLSNSDIKDLERYLDATRSTLLFARRVILVEGMSEVFLIPPLIKTVMGIDLQREGIALVAIHGTHFAPYAKLFKAGGIEKKCAVITDGDAQNTTKDDNDDFSDIQNTSIDDLKSLENPFFKVFSCITTFELELASHGNLKMFAESTNRLGALRVTKKIAKMAESKSLTKIEGLSASEDVLRAAKRFGKARFAQVASEYCAMAKDVPDYIKTAIDWLRK